MKKKCYTIRDLKGNYYMEPSLYRNQMDAVRAVEHSVNAKDRTNLLSANPEDFALFEIGEWSPETGTVEPCEKRHICDLIDLVKTE